MGENLYTTTCAGCHGPAGEGQGDFPPLVGSAGLASEDPAELITTFLNPEVHPFITNLSQDDLAAVLSFARTTFGSQAAVCAQQIGAGMTQ